MLHRWELRKEAVYAQEAVTATTKREETGSNLTAALERLERDPSSDEGEGEEQEGAVVDVSAAGITAALAAAALAADISAHPLSLIHI